MSDENTSPGLLTGVDSTLADRCRCGCQLYVYWLPSGSVETWSTPQQAPPKRGHEKTRAVTSATIHVLAEHLALASLPRAPHQITNQIPICQTTPKPASVLFGLGSLRV